MGTSFGSNAKVVLVRPLMGLMDLLHKTPPVSLLALCRYLDTTRYPVVLIDQCVPGWQAALRDALSGDMLLVGISCLTGFQQHFGVEIAALVREVAPKVPLVWGGIHPSALPEQTLREPLADIVVIGEGEHAFPELVEALATGADLQTVRGIAFKDAAGIVHRTPTREMLDMASLRPFRYDLVDVASYARDNRNFGPIVEAGRGCRYDCSFCYNPSFNQRRWRPRPAGEILDEMRALHRAHGCRVFHLCDDSFFTSPDRVWEFVGLLEAEGEPFQWNAEGNLHHLQRMGLEGLTRLKRAGLNWLSVGVESGSERVRRFFNRPVDLSQVLDFNETAAAVGLQVQYNFMTGAPIEEAEDVRATVALILRLLDRNPFAFVQAMYITVPYPQTRYLEQCKAHGLREPASFHEWVRFDPFIIAEVLPWMTPEKKVLFESLMFDSLFVDRKGSFHTTGSLFGVVVSRLARAYRPVARLRMAHSMPWPTWPGWVIQMASRVHRQQVGVELEAVARAVRRARRAIG